MNNDNTRTLNCAICGEDLVGVVAFLLHVHEHYREYPPYICRGPNCNHASVSKDARRSHEIHLIEKRHVCPGCDKAFHKRGNLRDHIAGRHLNIALHKCKSCRHYYKWNALASKCCNPEKEDVKSKRAQFRCDICSTWYLTRHAARICCGSKNFKDRDDWVRRFILHR